MPAIDCYTLLGTWPQTEVDLTLEALAAGMQARQVGRSLVTHTNAIFYDSALGNEEAVQLCKPHAALTPVAVLNPLRYPACLEELDRRLEQGTRAFRLCPREHGYPFSGAVGPLREVLSRLDRAAFLLVDLVALACPQLTADVAELLPVPTALSIQSDCLGLAIQAGRGNPNLWVETSALEAGGALEAAVEHLGAARVVFGSRAPLRTLGSAVMSVQYAQISDADRSAIFEGNLQRALG